MFFPLYIIEKFELDANEVHALLINGKTHLRGCIFVHDFGVTVHPNKGLVTIDIHPGNDPEKINKIIDGYGGEVNLFIQYRHELFWIMGIKKENVSVSPLTGDTKGVVENYRRITVPTSNVVISQLG